MMIFIIILLALATIGFLEGGFVALITTIIIALLGYFTSIYLSLLIVVAIASTLVYRKVSQR